jgi:hypothetical protein
MTSALAVVSTAQALLCPSYDSGESIMTVTSEDEMFRRCTIGALAAATLHLLTIAGGEYQISALTGAGTAEPIFVYLVNFVFFLGPFLLPLLARKSCVLVGIIAAPIVMLFALRMYCVFEFVWYGINSMARQKGDALGWVEMLFAAAADVAALVWLATLQIMRLVDVVRGWRNG